ncbi:VanZ family protein [Streptomyces sp. NPDC059247]|uniref:VanZ family protein n=1 Tax=Streptomyces sp. NPDC059247 TaxID=3346790 RepID=UPI0036D1B464
MIEAVFQEELVFLAFAIAATLAAGAFVYRRASRHLDRSRAVFYGLWASSAAGPVLLTAWSGSGVVTHLCAVNPSLTQSFATTQGQLNIVLFVPFGLFAVLATRRPLLSVGLGAVLSAMIETAQATVPFVTRLCDTDDLVSNTAGVLIGASAGALACRASFGGEPLGRAATRRAVGAGAAAVVLVSLTWATVIDPVRAVVPTDSPDASAQQTQALNTALTKALGGAYAVDAAKLHRNIEGPSTVNTPLPGGFAELTWPDRERLTVHFTPTSQGEGTHAYLIPGASGPVRTAEEAQRVATRYARGYAPWALRDSRVRVWPVDARAEDLGWVVEWRRWRGKLLMPMRLDILIEPSGRMTDLIARHVDDPALPETKVGESEAWEKFTAHHRVEPGRIVRERPVYLVERQGDDWRVHWRLAARDGGLLLSATVDATTGEVRNAFEEPAGAQPPTPEGWQGPGIQ